MFRYGERGYVPKAGRTKSSRVEGPPARILGLEGPSPMGGALQANSLPQFGFLDSYKYLRNTPELIFVTHGEECRNCVF